jgi:hypothetical protein
MDTPHDDEELRALGMLEASLGVRQRGAMEEQVSKETAEENLLDWLTVGRVIDQDTTERRADARSSREHEIPRGLWVLLMVLLVGAAVLCVAVLLSAG